MLDVSFAFHTSWDPIFYLHAKFGRDVLIGGGDMPPAMIFNFSFNASFHDTFMCVISDHTEFKSDDKDR